MKFILSVFLFIVTLLHAKDKIILNYWTPFTGGDARPMQFIVNKFNSSQNEAIVNMKVIKWNDYYKTLDKFINTKNGPDIAIVHASKLSELLSKNSITDLTQLSKLVDIRWESFTQNTLNNITFNNSYYAVPIDTHLLLMYYNKKYLEDALLLDKNGQLALENSPDGLMKFFNQLQKNLPKHIAALGQPLDNVYPFWIWLSLYHQLGGEDYIKNNQVLFDNPKGLKALKYLTTLRDNGIYFKKISDLQAYNMFKYEKSAIFFSGAWATWNFKQNKELDFAVAPFPKIFDKQATWSDSHTIALPAKIENKKKIIALKFANFVAENGLLWSKAGHIPSKIDIINSPEYKAQNRRAEYAKYLSFAFSMPHNPKLWECNDIMIKILANMMQTDKSAQSTLTLAKIEIEKILQ